MSYPKGWTRPTTVMAIIILVGMLAVGFISYMLDGGM